MTTSDILTTGNGESSVPRFPKSICTFCYKSCCYSYGESKGFKFEDSLKLFINLSERFVKRQWISNVEEHELNLLGCCDDCQEILGSFCEIYHEYKCSELRLEWKLITLINIMRLANRVPSRVKKLKQAFKNFNCDESETRLNSFTKCRQGLIAKGSKRLSETEPRVILERQISNNGHPPIFKDEVGTSDQPGKFDEFLGWIMTYSAVVMLATTTPVVVTTPGFNKNVEIEEDMLSCSLSIASYDALDDDEANMHYVKEENIYEDIQSMTDAVPHNAEELTEDNQAPIVTIGKMKNFVETEEPDASESESITEENAHIVIWNVGDGEMKIKDNQNDNAEETESVLEFDEIKCEDNVDILEEPENKFLEAENDADRASSSSGRYTLRENRKRTYQSTNEMDDNDEQGDEAVQTLSSSSSDESSDLSSDDGEPLEDTHSKPASKRKRGGKAMIKEVFSCQLPNCSQNFISQESLENHQKLHGSFKCNFCDETLDYAPDLALHERNHTKNETPNKPKCSRCPQKFKSNSNYFQHFLKVHLSEMFEETCPICNKKYRDNIALKRHFKTVHDTQISEPTPAEVQRCNQCPAYFNWSFQLLRHKVKNHFNGKCPVCEYSSPHSGRVQDHLYRIHPDYFSDFKYICDLGICKKRFGTETELEAHKNGRYHKNQDPWLQCPKCENKYRGKWKLNRHVNDVHVQDRTHVCKECGKAFKTKRNLDCHLTSHFGEIFDCEKCGVKVKNKQGLRVHMQRKHGPEVFICSECGKGFRIAIDLQHHLKFHRGPDSWNYQCSECGKKCVSKSSLQNHMGTHSKEKSIMCQFCGEKYSCRSNWTNHMRKKHKEEYEKKKDEEKAT